MNTSLHSRLTASLAAENGPAIDAAGLRDIQDQLYAFAGQVSRLAASLRDRARRYPGTVGEALADAADMIPGAGPGRVLSIIELIRTAAENLDPVWPAVAKALDAADEQDAAEEAERDAEEREREDQEPSGYVNRYTAHWGGRE